MTEHEEELQYRREMARAKNGSFPEDKFCAVCKAHMPGRKKMARYCSNKCRQRNKYDKVRVGGKKKVVDFD